MKTKIFILLCILLSAYCNPPTQAQIWNTLGDSTQYINHDSVTPGGTVFVIKQIDSLLYVGGGFVYAGDKKVNNIATWDGLNWDSLGSGDGSSSGVLDICKYNNKIYKGGYWFAKWNDTTWSAVGSGLTISSPIEALEYKDILFLGGGVIKINSINVHCVANWNDTNYYGLNGGVTGAFEHVYALSVFNNELIVGGVFSNAGSIEAYNIARWDGTNWNAMDTGVSADVYSMVVDTINNFLYVGGGLDNAGGTAGVSTPSGIARWDGFQWDSLSNDVVMYPLAMEFYRNKLFVAGGFYDQYGITYQGDTLNRIAYWNGNKWEPCGKGLNNTARALEVYNDELYVGGHFSTAGTDTAYGIARWHMPPDTLCDYLQAIIQPKNATLKISDSTTVHFYNNIIHGSSWLWDFGDGGTDTVRMPVHTYADTGVYNVSVIVIYQNCTDTAYTIITIVDDTGIKNNENDTTEYLGQNIPNPFDNNTTIPYYVPSGSKGFLQITDVKGELVDEYSLQQGKNTLTVSLEYLKAGTYFYTILIDGKAMQTKKMMLE